MVNHKDPYDVVAIGNYTKDTVVTPAGTRGVDGGGVRYSAIAAASLGCNVAAVTRLSEEDRHVVEALERAGVDVFATFTPSSTLMRLEYPTDNVDQRFLSVAATAGSITWDQIRSVAARTFLITSSIRGEVPLDVIRQLGTTGSTVSLDVQGFIRIRRSDGRLEHAPWPDAGEALAMVDILKTDAVEAEFITGRNDIHAAARDLSAMGPREIVLTHRNGLLVLAEGSTYEAEFHPKKLVGRSGRGDTCLGSYVAMRLDKPAAEATLWAAAATSLKMEADGPMGRSAREVERFIRDTYRETAASFSLTETGG